MLAVGGGLLALMGQRRAGFLNGWDVRAASAAGSNTPEISSMVGGSMVSAKRETSARASSNSSSKKARAADFISSFKANQPAGVFVGNIARHSLARL